MTFYERLGFFVVHKCIIDAFGPVESARAVGSNDRVGSYDSVDSADADVAADSQRSTWTAPQRSEDTEAPIPCWFMVRNPQLREKHAGNPRTLERLTSPRSWTTL